MVDTEVTRAAGMEAIRVEGMEAIRAEGMEAIKVCVFWICFARKNILNID